MDPQQRLLLECGYESLHGAWQDSGFGSSLTGVFLGIAGTEFAQVLAASPAGGSVYAATGSSASIAAGRISYTLGLHGPCVSYDTACSAALAAGPNCRFVKVLEQGWPYLFVVSSRAIGAGEELLLDYGDEYWASRGGAASRGGGAGA